MSAVRRDAQSNRARILQVAEEVFGRGGEAASTEEVARLAGVGIATVFRHFPTKAALLEAVLLERFGRLRARADALAGADDAGEAFFAYFRHMVEDSATKITIGEALIGTGALSEGDESPIDRAAADLRGALGVLLERAQKAGAVRDDVDLPEVYALLIGASRSAYYARLEPGVRDRSLAIIFDGLRGSAVAG
jgi:AcrR family transcriptional regulator